MWQGKWMQLGPGKKERRENKEITTDRLSTWDRQCLKSKKRWCSFLIYLSITLLCLVTLRWQLKINHKKRKKKTDHFQRLKLEWGWQGIHSYVPFLVSFLYVRRPERCYPLVVLSSGTWWHRADQHTQLTNTPMSGQPVGQKTDRRHTCVNLLPLVCWIHISHTVHIVYV